jgi:predicted transcriptional regulator
MDKSVHSFSLTPAQRRRLEKLAREAGRSPKSMFRFVLRDGFEQCEEDVKAAVAADKEAARLGTVPHAQVMEEARAVIARHARAPRRKAA